VKYIRRILKYLKPYKLLAAASLLLTVLSSFTGLLTPWPLAILVDNVLGGKHLGGVFGTVLGPAGRDPTSLLLIAVVASLVINLLVNLLTVLSEYVNTKLELNIVLDFRSDLFAHAQKLSVPFADQISTGRLMYGVNFEAVASGAVILSLQPMLQSALTLIGMLWIAFKIDPVLALVSLTVVPMLSYSVHYYARRIQPELHRVKGLEMESLSLVHEALQLLSVVAAFGREKHEEDRYREVGTRTVHQRVGLTVRQTVFALVVNMITAGGTALVLGLGAYHALHGQLTAGELLIVMSYINSVYKPLEAISHTIGSLQDRFVGLSIAYHLFDTEPTVQEAPDARPITEARGEVVFDDVSFHYPSRETTLKNISFTCRPGEVVAVVGPTGAGKSTLMSLMPRFYDVNDGRILLDGEDIRDLTLNSLREQISIVLQEPLLFSGSIADNIRYGRLDATDEDVVAAATAANCHDFVTRLPLQYETLVGERGVQLSGGERQRICVARAFLKDAPVLILDEPTSSIDSRTEALILDALDQLMVGRTTFIIAHRLSTIRHADKILVIDHGELVEQGSHEELLRNRGTYSQLHELQTSWSRRARRMEPAVESLVMGLGGNDRDVQALLSLEEVCARAEGLEALTQTVIDWSRSYLNAESGALLVYENGRLVPASAEPAQGEVPEGGAIAEAIAKREPVEVPLAKDDPWLATVAADLHPNSTGLCIPLVEGESVMGMLTMTAREGFGMAAPIQQLAASTIGRSIQAKRRSEAVAGDNAAVALDLVQERELVSAGASATQNGGSQAASPKLESSWGEAAYVQTPRKIVLLGRMSVTPWAGVIWQTLHYLEGLRRLGYDVYYVEAHGSNPFMFIEHEGDDGSLKVAGFIERIMRRFDFGDRWAFRALHSDGACYGLSDSELKATFASADAVINLHGGTLLRDEYQANGHLVYLETDPVGAQIDLHSGKASTFDFLSAHDAHFTYAENYGEPCCRLPVFPQFDFKPTRQPVVLDFWPWVEGGSAKFTTVGNWKQGGREVYFEGDVFHWSKHLEFLKFIDLPSRTSQELQLALSSSSYDDSDLELLHENGWDVLDSLTFSADTECYKDYLLSSRGEFTVAKDQNVRLNTGWFSDRSATYLAAGRPVVTQDTGFVNTLPTGAGLFSFSSTEEAVAAIEAINGDYEAHRRAAWEIAHDYFRSDVVLKRLLQDIGLAAAG
jgi:ATP-binding cassette subfamily B protein